MAYCTIDDIKLRVGSQKQYNVLTEDTSGGESGDTLVSSVIALIEAWVTEQLSKSYESPATSLQNSTEVQINCTELVYCHLLKRRSLNGANEKSDTIQLNRCTGAKNFFIDAGKGKKDLISGGVLVPKKKNPYVFRVINNNTRVYEDE